MTAAERPQYSTPNNQPDCQTDESPSFGIQLHLGQVKALHELVPQKVAMQGIEGLVHGLKYAFPAVRGGITRGGPTAGAAKPLSKVLAASDELSPVWPAMKGPVKGQELKPLYRTVVSAVSHDEKLYELLALVDAIRSGRARERQLAKVHLSKRLERK